MTMLRMAFLRVVLVALLLMPFAVSNLHAHVTKIAGGEIRLSGDQPELVVEMSAHDLAVALGIETDLETPMPAGTFTRAASALRAYVTERLSLTGDTRRACTPDGVSVTEDTARMTVTLTLRFVCPPGMRTLTIGYHLFFDIDREHRFLGIGTYGDGRTEPFLFDRSMTTMTIDLSGTALARASFAAQSWIVRAWHIFLLGAEHIAIGWDHVLFLLALILLDPAIMPLVRSITAFTLAHSLTLALAWFGVLTPSAMWVEVLIAVSIFVVALENVINRPFTSRWKIAGLFGLVHGLGFYSVLNALELGRSDVVTTLLSFNLGIEAGQIAIMIVLALPLIYLRKHSWYSIGARTASGLIACTGLWLVIARLGFISL